MTSAHCQQVATASNDNREGDNERAGGSRYKVCHQIFVFCLCTDYTMKPNSMATHNTRWEGPALPALLFCSFFDATLPVASLFGFQCNEEGYFPLHCCSFFNAMRRGITLSIASLFVFQHNKEG